MQLTNIGRRHFIQQSGMALGALMLPLAPRAPKLCFSTLGCPDWDLPTIIRFATQNGYEAIELRGIGTEMFLPQSPYFSKEQMAATKAALRDGKIKVIGLGSSAQLHHTDAATAEKHLDEAKKYIDLAAQLECPYVRVFPEKLAAGAERQKSVDLIAERLMMLGNSAKGSKVTVLIESHGELVNIADLKYVLERAGNNTGMIWDVVNMWSVTKEAPADVWSILNTYIKHVHLKDVVWDADAMRYVLFGKGVAPVKDAVGLLAKAGYKGYYSFEWEKRWHPEIEAPEIALAQYPAVVKSYFRRE
jgi:sugar phosphate isomerase/epimerase